MPLIAATNQSQTHCPFQSEVTPQNCLANHDSISFLFKQCKITKSMIKTGNAIGRTGTDNWLRKWIKVEITKVWIENEGIKYIKKRTVLKRPDIFLKKNYKSVIIKEEKNKILKVWLKWIIYWYKILLLIHSLVLLLGLVVIVPFL